MLRVFDKDDGKRNAVAIERGRAGFMVYGTDQAVVINDAKGMYVV